MNEEYTVGYAEGYQTGRNEAIDELEQENRLLRARNDRLEAEVNATSVKKPKKGSYEAVFGHLDMTPDQLGNYMIELQEKAALYEAQQCKWPTCQSEEYQQDLAEQIKRELYTGDKPTQEQIVAGAKALSIRTAKICRTDEGDQWKFYSEELIEDARVVLTAAFNLKG